MITARMSNAVSFCAKITVYNLKYVLAHSGLMALSLILTFMYQKPISAKHASFDLITFNNVSDPLEAKLPRYIFGLEQLLMPRSLWRVNMPILTQRIRLLIYTRSLILNMPTEGISSLDFTAEGLQEDDNVNTSRDVEEQSLRECEQS